MCVRVPGLASGLRGKAERARREGGVVEVRAQPASSVARPPPDEERRGKGRSKPAGRAHQEPRGGGASGEGEAPPPLFAAVEEESQDPYPLPQTQKRPSPPSPRKQSPAQPRTLAFPNREPQPGRPRLAPPRRPSLGPQSARGAGPGVVVRPGPLPRSPPCVAATTGRRRRGGGGGGGVLLSRPLPSPELAPNVRARWSEAKTKVVLPRCAARAESAAEAAPPPRGHLEDSGFPRGSAPGASGVFAGEDRTTSTVGSSAIRIPASLRPGGRCIPPL